MKHKNIAYVDLSDPNHPKLDFKSQKQDFYKNIKSFKDGQRITVMLETYYRTRSVGQNGFYWHIFLQEQIECFKEYWGEVYDKDEMHEWNKANFWGEEKTIEATGEVIKTPASSTKQSTVEWEEKLEIIRQWFRQNFTWEISYPDQQKSINYS